MPSQPNISAELKAMVRELKKFMVYLPREISDMAVEEFKENFRRGGYRADSGFVKWKDRAKKDKGRGILIKSGRLRRGIQARPGVDLARVVNDVPYAEAHNEGFTGTVTVKAHTRRKFKKGKVGTGRLTKSGKERMKSIKTKTGDGKVRSHSRKVNLPARPFMKPGKPFYAEVEKYIENNLSKIFNK